jgi:hypothetical protein
MCEYGKLFGLSFALEAYLKHPFFELGWIQNPSTDDNQSVRHRLKFMNDKWFVQFEQQENNKFHVYFEDKKTNSVLLEGVYTEETLVPMFKKYWNLAQVSSLSA